MSSRGPVTAKEELVHNLVQIENAKQQWAEGSNGVVRVRTAARSAGTTIAAVYMAKSRVGRLVRREIAHLRDFEP